MADYNLHGLNTRDFQHLVQAIARKSIAAGVAAYGDGPDGGRDLSFRGRMDYPSASSPWDGYLVVGCKFRQRPVSSQKDGEWALAQLKADLRKFKSKTRKLPAPDFYIFATNVALTSAHEVGYRDQVETALKESASPKLKGYAIWDYNDLRGFIDGDAEIRRTYAHLITAGDVFTEMMTCLELKRPDFINVMHSFLQKELIAEATAKLQSAGEDPERQIPLANLFIDLPFADSAEKAVLVDEIEDEKLPKVVQFLLQAGSQVLRKTSNAAESAKGRSKGSSGKFVIVGGPGQGKSTFGQYLCQLHRAAILRDRPTHLLDERVPIILTQLAREQSNQNGLPLARRFPLRVELRNFSYALQVDEKLTFLQYIRQDLERLGNAAIALEDLRSWLSCYPWLLVLDGLDEVPASSNREDVLREITNLRVDMASTNADALLIATTRPQGYSSEFAEDVFQHLYLTPLSPKQALYYGRKLVRAWCSSDQRREDELVGSLEKACGNSTTSRLMQSPLQVTIMTALLDETGEPPQQRYRLFAEYYRTIYKRETRRKLLGGILSERQRDIDTIHQEVGLLLHARGETTSKQSRGKRIDGVDSALSDEEFRSLVKQRLSQIGIAEPKASELLDTISAGSLQRLVFLVRPREGWVRFDITSFKEFMAAEALMNGSDEDVRHRLTAIAGIIYWRNAFQFAVGKCVVEKEHLLDTIIALCVGLNDEKAGSNHFKSRHAAKSAQAVYWGSLLALDILADGTSRQYPGVESVFARTALELLKGSDQESAARLASVYHSDLHALYEDAVKEIFKIREPWEQVTALRLLADLSDRGVQWAGVLLKLVWPDDPVLRRAVLLDRSMRFKSQWLIEQLAEVAPMVEPYCLMRYHHSSLRSNVVESAIQPLLRALHIVEPAPNQQLTIANRSKWQDVIAQMSLMPIDADSDLWAGLRKYEFTNSGWFPAVASARFSSEPSATSLARELRWLAERWDPEYNYLTANLAWPLAACLYTVKSRDDLNRLALAVDEGRLGDKAHWKRAEERWRTNGITDDDLLEEDQSLPFRTTIAEVGVPVGAIYAQAMPGERLLERGNLVGDLDALPNQSTRAWIARSIISSFLLYRSKRSVFGPAELRRLHVLAQAMPDDSFPFQVGLDDLLARAAGDGFNLEWIEFFDWLGKQRIWFMGEAPSAEAVQILVAHFVTNPDGRRGLLSVIAKIVETGCRVTIPRTVLDLASTWGEDARCDAISLRLATGAMSSAEISQMAHEIVRFRNSVMMSYTFFRMATVWSPEQGVELALCVLKSCTSGTDAMHGLMDNARRILVEFLNKQPSDLQDPDTWKGLKLGVWRERLTDLPPTSVPGMNS